MWELDYIKKAERRRTDASELWCWKRLLRILPCKEIKPVHPNGDQSWIFIGRTDGWSWSSNTLATWCEEVTHLKGPWCWERLRAGGEGDDRGWDGWMASLTWRMWVWVSSGSWWWTGRPGVLQSMGSQRLLDCTELIVVCLFLSYFTLLYIKKIIIKDCIEQDTTGGGQWLCSTVVVSATHHHESTTGRHTSPPLNTPSLSLPSPPL